MGSPSVLSLQLAKKYQRRRFVRLPVLHSEEGERCCYTALIDNNKHVFYPQRRDCPDQVIVAPTSKKMKACDLPYRFSRT